MGKHTKSKYSLSILDFKSEEPKWVSYSCCSYDDIIKLLKENHSITMTRDVVQNIALDRYNKRGQYKYIKINKL